MSPDAAAQPVDQPAAASLAPGLREAISDYWVVAARNLKIHARIPEAMFASVIQPIIIILLLRFVLGGAIDLPRGVEYVDFMMAGVYVYALANGSVGTAIVMAEEKRNGVMERFRSLPMANSAVLVGRTGADLVRSLPVLALMTVLGVLVGYRFSTGALAFAAAMALLLLFAFALSWVFAAIGLAASTGETAQLLSVSLLLPMLFASSAFVPLDTMPGWVQTFTAHQPLTAIVDATRALLTEGPAAEAVWTTLAWSGGLLAVFAPLSTQLYRRTFS